MYSDSGLSFGELILRTAEAAGVHSAPTTAGGISAIPDNADILDRIKRCVNDGLSRMYRDYPRWTALRPILSIQFNPSTPGPTSLSGDVSRQALPTAVSITPIGRWVASTDDGWSGPVSVVSIETMLASKRSISDSGMPRIAAVVANGYDASTSAPTYELRVYPAPSQTVTISGRATVIPPRLVENDQRHPLGSEHDQTVVDAACAAWYANHPDSKTRSEWTARYLQSLQASVVFDRQKQPGALGRTTMPGSGDIGSTGAWLGVRSFDGVPI